MKASIVLLSVVLLTLASQFLAGEEAQSTGRYIVILRGTSGTEIAQVDDVDAFRKSLSQQDVAKDVTDTALNVFGKKGVGAKRIHQTPSILQVVDLRNLASPADISQLKTDTELKRQISDCQRLIKKYPLVENILKPSLDALEKTEVAYLARIGASAEADNKKPAQAVPAGDSGTSASVSESAAKSVEGIKTIDSFNAESEKNFDSIKYLMVWKRQSTKPGNDPKYPERVTQYVLLEAKNDSELKTLKSQLQGMNEEQRQLRKGASKGSESVYDSLDTMQIIDLDRFRQDLGVFSFSKEALLPTPDAPLEKVAAFKKSNWFANQEYYFSKYPVTRPYFQVLENQFALIEKRLHDGDRLIDGQWILAADFKVVREDYDKQIAEAKKKEEQQSSEIEAVWAPYAGKVLPVLEKDDSRFTPESILSIRDGLSKRVEQLKAVVDVTPVEGFGKLPWNSSSTLIKDRAPCEVTAPSPVDREKIAMLQEEFGIPFPLDTLASSRGCDFDKRYEYFTVGDKLQAVVVRFCTEPQAVKTVCDILINKYGLPIVNDLPPPEDAKHELEEAKGNGIEYERKLYTFQKTTPLIRMTYTRLFLNEDKFKSSVESELKREKMRKQLNLNYTVEDKSDFAAAKDATGFAGRMMAAQINGTSIKISIVYTSKDFQTIGKQQNENAVKQFNNEKLRKENEDKKKLQNNL